MMITTPLPVALKSVPTTPAGPAPAAPTGAVQVPGSATTQTPDADAAAAQQAAIVKLQKTSAADALAQVDVHLAKIASLSVGGGTPEGTQGAKVASMLLTDASMLLQHADVQAMQQLRNMATELHMRLMSSASGLAFMGGQVALAGGSKTPIKLGEIAAGSIADTKATMADVAAAITPPAVAKAEVPTDPGGPIAMVPAPVAPNGNGGVVGPVPANPTKIEPTAAGVSII